MKTVLILVDPPTSIGIQASDASFIGRKHDVTDDVCEETNTRMVLFTSTKAYEAAMLLHAKSPMFTNWGYGHLAVAVGQNLSFDYYQFSPCNKGLLFH